MFGNNRLFANFETNLGVPGIFLNAFNSFFFLVDGSEFRFVSPGVLALRSQSRDGTLPLLFPILRLFVIRAPHALRRRHPSYASTNEVTWRMPHMFLSVVTVTLVVPSRPSCCTVRGGATIFLPWTVLSTHQGKGADPRGILEQGGRDEATKRRRWRWRMM